MMRPRFYCWGPVRYWALSFKRGQFSYWIDLGPFSIAFPHTGK